MPRRGVVCLLLLVALAGCGAAAGGDGGERRGLEGAVRWERTGGIAGVRETLVVRPDGSVTTGDGRVRQAGMRGLRDLVAALAGWEDVDPSQRGPAGGADRFQHRVTYAGHTVTTEDGAGQDARLQRVLAALRALR